MATHQRSIPQIWSRTVMWRARTAASQATPLDAVCTRMRNRRQAVRLSGGLLCDQQAPDWHGLPAVCWSIGHPAHCLVPPNRPPSLPDGLHARRVQGRGIKWIQSESMTNPGDRFSRKPRTRHQSFFRSRPTQRLPRIKESGKPVKEHPVKGNNGLGNGEDPAPPGNPRVNDGPGTTPGHPKQALAKTARPHRSTCV